MSITSNTINSGYCSKCLKLVSNVSRHSSKCQDTNKHDIKDLNIEYRKY
jgi:hypothetical protein